MKIGVYDKNSTVRMLFSNWFTRYSIAYNIDFDVCWISKELAASQLLHIVDDIVLIFISLDSDPELTFSSELYAVNPECRICYYRDTDCDLYPLIRVRPIDYFVLDASRDNINILFDKVLSDVMTTSALFRYNTKQYFYCYPYRSVVFVESDLKYVYIHRLSGKEDKFFAKLSDVEKVISTGFIRIHQSYLVNRLHIENIDKKLHALKLYDGTVLPISDKYYPQLIKSVQNGLIFENVSIKNEKVQL